jgi:peptidoglycan/LPS O-acetylase OafA/YrhL
MDTSHTSSRRHDLDALRAAAMLLGIAYHVALSFALGFPWMVQDSHQNQGSYLFQAAVHGFRMPMFMLVSGFFTAMLWRQKGLKSLLWHRFRRVLLPCLLGLITVVPAMNWAVEFAGKSGAIKSQQLAMAEPASANIWAAIRKGDSSSLQSHLKGGISLTAQHPIFGVSPLP